MYLHVYLLAVIVKLVASDIVYLQAYYSTTNPSLHSYPCVAVVVVRFIFVLSPVRLVFFLTLVTVIGAGDPDMDASWAAELVFDGSQSGTSIPPLAGGDCEFLADGEAFTASGISPTLSTT